MREKHSAGKNIGSFCTKCKLNLDHTIMAMAGEEIARVRCQTCGTSHKYRGVAEALKKRKPRTARGVGEEATAALVWETGLADAKGQERDYDVSVKYRVGDVVHHQRFGKGVVVQLYTNKCAMLFKDKERLMASTN